MSSRAGARPEAEAAVHLSDLRFHYPDSEFAPAALYNGAIGYERLQRYEPAMRLYQRVVDDYPDCEFVSWTKPLEQPCPKCESLMVASGKPQNEGEVPAKCTNEECGFEDIIFTADRDEELLEKTA